MAIDFSELLGDDEDPILPPRDIFFTLNRDPQFAFPRDIQTEVMSKWFDVRKKRDNIIKLNVGSGKTLIGLLLLQSSLNEGLGPALYITPDKQLAEQVIQEAGSLGIDVTEDPKSAAYASGECICVTNIYKLFNGKSVFGVGTSKIEIGSVIIDDAHACVSTVADQFRLTLKNTHEAYKRILSIISEDLKSYSEPQYLGIDDGDPNAYIEIPFWSWSAHQSEILKALHDHRSDDELQFTYPLLKDLLPLCRCVIGGQYLEIEPDFPATDIIQPFRRAKRRIYMTATLSDDSVAVTHFGAEANSIGKPIVPTSSQSMGERMILMPQELNSDLTIPDVRAMLVDLAKTENVVVLVPSSAAAKEWASSANQVLLGDSVSAGIEKLRNGHVGLTVLINRYDGIDLPGDACRVLAISGLPEVASYADLVEGDILNGSSLNLRRQVERIEQGMGRGVRSNDDYCAVVLLGPKLTGRLRSQDGQSMLTPATKAQLELSRKVAKRLTHATVADIKAAIKQCVYRDTNWIKAAKKVLVGLTANDDIKLDPSKLALRMAFDFARRNQYKEALQALDKAIDGSGEDQVKAWLLSKKAAFQHFVDADAAQKTLMAAHSMEPRVLKPIHGATYKKLAPSVGQQSTTLISNHSARFVDATGMILFCDALCSDLQFLPETSDKFEAAVKDLAWFLGLQSQRPEKEYKEGPDNLWAIPGGEFFIIECKNGVTAGSGIAKKDAGQLGQSMEWFKNRYPSSPGTPLVIHPEKNMGPAATLVSGMRVIDVKGLEKLKKNLRAFAKQLADPNVSSKATEVAARLNQFELSGKSFVNGFSTPAK